LVVARLALNYAVLAALTGLGLGLLPAKVLTELALALVTFQVQRRIVFSRRPSAVPEGPEVETAGAAVRAPAGLR
jgi:hypothetical protein